MVRVVEVEWGDAFIDTDDFDPKKAKNTEPVYRKTIGYLIAKNQHGYILATDVYNKKKDGVSTKMFVPHGMIVSVQEMKIGKTIT